MVQIVGTAAYRCCCLLILVWVWVWGEVSNPYHRPAKPHLGRKITPDCPAPVPDDEVFHRVSLVFSGRGIAVLQHQVKSGRVPSLQDGAHIQHGFDRQHDCSPFIRRRVVLVLKEGHPDSELSLPIHSDVQGTENTKSTRVRF